MYGFTRILPSERRLAQAAVVALFAVATTTAAAMLGSGISDSAHIDGKNGGAVGVRSDLTRSVADEQVARFKVEFYAEEMKFGPADPSI